MAGEAAAGVVFHGALGRFDMAARVREKMLEFDWRLGHSQQCRYYYVYGKRADGLKDVIAPEEEADGYHLGVHFAGMAFFPERPRQMEIANAQSGERRRHPVNKRGLEAQRILIDVSDFIVGPSFRVAASCSVISPPGETR